MKTCGFHKIIKATMMLNVNLSFFGGSFPKTKISPKKDCLAGWLADSGDFTGPLFT